MTGDRSLHKTAVWQRGKQEALVADKKSSKVMIHTEIAHAGIISSIHIIAAKTNIASERCCNIVMESRPIHDIGIKPTKSVRTATAIKPICFFRTILK